MAERYKKVYSLPENLYAPGSPVLISSGALYKDSQTGKILAQLKFRNLANKGIIALKVSLSACDVFGMALEGVREHQYLDLYEARDSEFGDREAIPLPNPVTRVFKPRCTAVIFADGSNWIAPSEAEWVCLPDQTGIYNQLGHLADQYQRDTSTKSRFVPLPFRDLWLCSCGAINRENESVCHCCYQERTKLFFYLDKNGLLQRNSDYEKEKAEQAARKIAASKARRAKLLKIVTYPLIVVSAAKKKAEQAAKKTKASKPRRPKLLKAVKYAAIAVSAAAVIVAGVFVISHFGPPIFKYNSANSLMKDGKYQEAITAFEALEGYRDSGERITECQYLEAIQLIDAGQVLEAYNRFTALKDYKDSAEKAYALYSGYPNFFLQPGAYYTFGSYEQDNNTKNGPEEIEWLVLDVSENKALLISKNALDSKPFSEDLSSSNWHSSSLRNWLNGEFFDTAFAEDEQALICTTDIADDSGSSDTVTRDRLFLLSYAQIQTYLTSPSSRLCEATDYAISHGATNKGPSLCRWLLRTNGRNEIYVDVVSSHNIMRNDYRVTDTGLGIRPAMWITLY